MNNQTTPTVNTTPAVDMTPVPVRVYVPGTKPRVRKVPGVDIPALTPKEAFYLKIINTHRKSPKLFTGSLLLYNIALDIEEEFLKMSPAFTDSNYAFHYSCVAIGHGSLKYTKLMLDKFVKARYNPSDDQKKTMNSFLTRRCNLDLIKYIYESFDMKKHAQDLFIHAAKKKRFDIVFYLYHENHVNVPIENMLKLVGLMNGVMPAITAKK